jgi:phage shock protein C
MQRIIQINIVGRVIPIEEDAYQVLKSYIASIERQFMREQGKDEIIQDIEARIAELFFIRLNAGAPAIDKDDVNKVIETLGAASEINDGNASSYGNAKTQYSTGSMNNQQYQYEPVRRLYRNPNDKVIGGVCSGVANYFDIDPVIVRLVMAVLLLAGIGVLGYIIAWIIIPVAKTPADLGFMTTGKPMDFHTMSNNVAQEMQDLKRRGEDMSRDLKDFFSKKK